MPVTAKKPLVEQSSNRQKLQQYMELRGITEWFQARLDLFSKPVASVPHAPSFIELLDIEVDPEELVDLLVGICGEYWANESDLDTALAILQTPVGKKLVDRTAELGGKLTAAFDHYIKTKIDAKAEAFKRSALH